MRVGLGGTHRDNRNMEAMRRPQAAELLEGRKMGRFPALWLRREGVEVSTGRIEPRQCWGT